MEQNMVIMVKNLDKAEGYAKELLAHVAAIKKIQKSMGWDGTVDIEAEFKTAAD